MTTGKNAAFLRVLRTGSIENELDGAYMASKGAGKFASSKLKSLYHQLLLIRTCSLNHTDSLSTYPFLLDDQTFNSMAVRPRCTWCYEPSTTSTLPNTDTRVRFVRFQKNDAFIMGFYYCNKFAEVFNCTWNEAPTYTLACGQATHWRVWLTISYPSRAL